jgi:hypothetical protein
VKLRAAVDSPCHPPLAELVLATTPAELAQCQAARRAGRLGA